jgi:flap endonuclease-1
MGIKGLKPLIEKYVDDIYVERHLSEYAYKKVAVDISLYMFKYKATFQERWPNAFITLVSVLRKHNIHCVFIFDGKAPIEKDEERKSRSDDRVKREAKASDMESDIEEFHRSGEISPLIMQVWEEKQGNPNRLLGGKKPFNISVVQDHLNHIKSQIIHISQSDFELAKNIFDNLEVPYIQAEGEAESFASHLCVRGLVDAVASEDTDVLAYGCPIFMTKINTSEETCIEIDYTRLVQSMNMSPSQFTDLCIMCGTDYNSNIKGVGPVNSYKLLLQYGTIDAIEAVVDPVSGQPKYDVSPLKYHRVRELFTVPETVHARIPYCGKPDMTRFRRFLWQNNISYNVDNIEPHFRPKAIVFEDE